MLGHRDFMTIAIGRSVGQGESSRIFSNMSEKNSITAAEPIHIIILSLVERGEGGGIL